MIYRAFWLLKMVMFRIFSRAIGSSKIRESPIENEDNIQCHYCSINTGLTTAWLGYVWAVRTHFNSYHFFRVTATHVGGLTRVMAIKMGCCSKI